MWVFLLPLAFADSVLLMEGEVPDDGLDHFFLEFEVPQGTAEIEVRHDDLSDANILDWGLDSPDGFRGWGGGNAEPAVVGEEAASRSYLTGPLTPGTWRVVVGKAKIAEPPGEYAVEIELRETPTLPVQGERAPYEATAALEVGPRWFQGDLHVHDLESGDAVPTLDEVAAFARARGLDFVVLSDHDTISQDDFLVDLQSRWPDLLLIPGIEYTTYQGHAGAIGATEWVDHRLGQPDATIQAAAAAIHGQGALLSVNHPTLDLGDACIGCAWALDLDPAEIDAMEIVTGGWSPVGGLFYAGNVALWESWLDEGARIAAVGGSDDHRAGEGTGSFDSPIGSPTTLVWAEELSAQGILDGIRAGLTVVKLQGPEDPMLELWPDPMPEMGEDPTAEATFTATVSGGEGDTLVWWVDGAEGDRVAVSTDPFLDDRVFEAGQRVRAVLEVEGNPRVLTSTWWVGEAPVSTPPEGCGCAQGGRSGAPWLVGLALLVRRRRDPQRRESSSSIPAFAA